MIYKSKIWVKAEKAFGLPEIRDQIAHVYMRKHEVRSSMPALTPGQKFGKYIIVRQLGGSISGESYEADDSILMRKVTLKLIRPQQTFAEAARRQFFREMQLQSELKHPFVTTLLDFGEVENQLYLARRYTTNGSLLSEDGRRLFAAPLHIPTAISYTQQLGQALDALHKQGYVHGSLTFSNILILRIPLNTTPEQEFAPFLLSDAGLIQFVRRHADPRITFLPISAAPEQYTKRVVPASDQFALAALLYFWLTGTLPYTGTPEEIEQQKLRERIPSMTMLNSRVSLKQEVIIRRALSVYPEDRYTSMEDFIRALENTLRAERPTATPTQSIDPIPAQTPTPGSQPEVAPSPTPAPNPQPDPIPTIPEPDHLPDPETPSIEPPTHPEPQPEITPLPDPVTRPGSEPEMPPQTEPQPRPGTPPEIRPATHPNPEPQPRPDVVPQPQPNVIPTPGPDISTPQPDVIPMPQPDTIQQPQPTIVPNPQFETVIEHTPHTLPMPEQPILPEPQPEPIPMPVEPAPQPLEEPEPITIEDPVVISVPEASLVIHSPYMEETPKVLLSKEEITIGRAGSSDILLDKDPQTSRHHAVIRKDEIGYRIYDLHSISGLLINGEHLQNDEGHLLADHDKIGIGGYTLTFHLPQEIDTSAAIETAQAH